MLNILRNFSKTKVAGVLVAIIIIPFIFWGMGSVFSGGNKNSIAKINNHNLSTQDFADHINNSKINPEYIKENINDNILEKLLTQLISKSLIDIEINELNFLISDEFLAKKIKIEKSFQDENNNFSRSKYEKFLLENSMQSVKFEQGIRNNELKKKLFTYIGGGIKAPFFLTNKTYKDELKTIEIDYLNLDTIYINKNEITLEDVKKHIIENEEKFLIEKVDISLIKITPENLSGDTEFTENFFSKIDEIDDLIANKNKINEIARKYNLKIETFDGYHPETNSEDLLNEIYKNRNKNVLELLDKNDFFLLYEVKNLKKILPSLENENFITMAKNDLFEMNKYNTQIDLMKKIQKKTFTNEDFSKLSKGLIENLKINSINDTNKFTTESVNLLYSQSINNFSLVPDNENNIYLVKIKNIYENNLSKNSKEIKMFHKKANMVLRDNLYKSYDFLLNEKYKIKINENTFDRMKNYFR